MLKTDSIHYIFIDNGGVITDNSVLSRNYLRRLGELLSPHFGGNSEQWAAANGRTWPRVWQRHLARMETFDVASGDIEREFYLTKADWLRSMCAEIGVEAPANEDDCVRLAAAVQDTIIIDSQAAFPGALDALKELALRYTLFSASEGLSRELHKYLGALGVAGLFERLYGSDYVNTPKQMPQYHERIFAHAGIDPSTALVVDDWPVAIERARAAGARTALVAREDGAEHGSADIVVRSLAELPALLAGPGSA